MKRAINRFFFYLLTVLKKRFPSLDLPIFAKPYYSGFDQTRNPYNSISVASDGKIYYILSTDSLDIGGRFFVYDPASDEITFLADLNEICGEDDIKAIPQGKSHTSFFEKDGKLYFSTHVSVYEVIDGAERFPKYPPDGYEPYPGGHFLSYDLSGGQFEDLATVPHGEGILTMTMDTDRNHLYGITWPVGYFIHYDLDTGELQNLGFVSEMGEAGTPGDDFRVLCRAMFVDPEDGSVYYSTSEGDIYSYNPSRGMIERLKDVDLRLDYFGRYDPTRQGTMAYNWRQILWHPQEEVAYGVHGNSGYLFRFDPRRPKIELVERLTSKASKRSGMYDQFCYGYLGFDLGPDGQTLYYLTGGPIYINGKRVEGNREITIGARGLENLHLVTYNILKQEYMDHGPIYYTYGGIPIYVNSIAIGNDGNIYTLARLVQKDKVVQDLVKIPDPLKNPEGNQVEQRR